MRIPPCNVSLKHELGFAAKDICSGSFFQLLLTSLKHCTRSTLPAYEMRTRWRHHMETPVPVNYPHKGQWRGALMGFFICVWINGWVNNREAGDLRRHRRHYDVILMSLITTSSYLCLVHLYNNDVSIDPICVYISKLSVFAYMAAKLNLNTGL